MKNAIKALFAALAIVAASLGLFLAREALADLTGGVSDWLLAAALFAAITWGCYRTFNDLDEPLVDWEPTPLEAIVCEVLEERKRLIDREGFLPERDRELHPDAAAFYAANAGAATKKRGGPLASWPWSREWWKPSTPRRDLVKAGALILAELERLDHENA